MVNGNNGNGNGTAAVNGVAAPATTTLHFRRMHPGGGALGRCSFGIPGVPGIVVVDVAMFVGGVVPQTLVVNLAMATPAPRNVAAVTSAVVAGAANAVATATGAPLATPA